MLHRAQPRAYCSAVNLQSGTVRPRTVYRSIRRSKATSLSPPNHKTQSIRSLICHSHSIANSDSEVNPHAASECSSLICPSLLPPHHGPHYGASGNKDRAGSHRAPEETQTKTKTEFHSDSRIISASRHWPIAYREYFAQKAPFASSSSSRAPAMDSPCLLAVGINKSLPCAYQHEPRQGLRTNNLDRISSTVGEKLLESPYRARVYLSQPQVDRIL